VSYNASTAAWDMEVDTFNLNAGSGDLKISSADKEVSVSNGAVKMYYTGPSDYGITDESTFYLGSTNQIAGWTFDTGKLYNGTDIELDAANKSVSVYNGAVKMYYTGTSDYGLTDGANFYLGSTNQIAGWTFDSNKLYNGTDIQLNAADKIISIDSGNVKLGYHLGTYNIDGLTIGNDRFALSGIQLDYNSGSPRFYTGNGSDKYIQYDTNGLTVQGDIKTNSSGQRIELDQSENILKWYDSNGNERLRIDDNLYSTYAGIRVRNAANSIVSYFTDLQTRIEDNRNTTTYFSLLAGGSIRSREDKLDGNEFQVDVSFSDLYVIMNNLPVSANGSGLDAGQVYTTASSNGTLKVK